MKYQYKYRRIYEAVPKNPDGDLAKDHINRLEISLELNNRLGAYVLNPSVISEDPVTGLSSVIYSLKKDDELTAVTKKLILEQAKRQSKKKFMKLLEKFDDELQRLMPNIEQYLSVDWTKCEVII